MDRRTRIWQSSRHIRWPEWDSENELFEADLDRLAPYVERVLERMPIWRDAGIKRIVCGAIPHTPDANPLLGPAAGLKNFWQCCGASIGIASGAGCGKYLAQGCRSETEHSKCTRLCVCRSAACRVATRQAIR